MFAMLSNLAVFGVTNSAEFHKNLSNLLIFLLSVLTVLCFINSFTNYSSISEGGAIATFDNAAGAASCICIIIPFALYYDNESKFSSLVGKILLPLSAVAVCVMRSRTGLLCVGILLLAFYFKKKKNEQRNFLIISLLIILVVLVALFFMSPDSSKGRAFILLNTLTMLVEHPLGLGFGGFRKEYMNYQADFFKAHPDSSFGMLADNVRTPLNDFLLFTVDYGILGLLFIVSLILLIVFLYRHSRSPHRFVYLSSLFAICIFALFSYPFSYPFTWIMLFVNVIALTADSDSYLVNGLKNNLYNLTQKNIIRIPFALILIIALCFTVRRVNYERLWKTFDDNPALVSQEKKQEIENYFSDNPHFIAYMAINKYEHKEFADALKNIRKCERNYWADYELSLYEGMTLMKMNKNEEAVSALEQAHYMCPNRFYPLYYQMKSYLALGDNKESKKIAVEILNKPVKVYSQDIMTVRHEALEVMSLK